METAKKRKGSKESSVMERAERSWRAKPILSRELTEDPPLQQVYVGLLKDKRDISAAIPRISRAVPGFHHLKRCSWRKLVLAPLKRSTLHTDRGEEEAVEADDDLTEEELKSILRGKGFDISVLEESFQVVNVPSRAPKTKAQAARASMIWPVNFHPEPNIEKLIDGSIFEEHQLEAIENYMRLAIEAARLEAVGRRDYCNGAAVIVDPEDGRILTVAASKMDLHPMWHASMLALDLVAQLQGGGAWSLNDSTNLLEPPGIPVQSQDPEPHAKEAATAAAAAAEKKSFKRKHQQEPPPPPLCYPKSLSELGRGRGRGRGLPSTWQSHLNSTSTAASSRRNKCSSILDDDADDDADDDDEPTKPDSANPERYDPYLCTGYWAFLVKEPCPLCAMALLHSRILRIFYSLPNEKTGILGTNGILHALPGLNHRYQVWSGILEEESREAVGIIEQRDISSDSKMPISLPYSIQSTATSLTHAFPVAGQPFDR